MHPLVRDLYKRAIVVGRDYPSPNGEGIEYVRRKWKEALRDPENCRLLILPTIIANDGEKKSPEEDYDDAEARAAAMENERIVRKAVGRGRYVIREMEATVQFKKYRAMRRRYGEGMDAVGEASRIGKSVGDMLRR